MKKLLVIWHVLSVYVGFAQHLRSYDVDSSFNGKQLILVNGTVDYSASTMRNEVLSPLIFGGYIDSMAKGRSMDADKPFNTVGLEASASYTHYVSLKNKEGFPSRWMVGPTLGSTFMGSLKYTSDLYTLAFYGNEPFLGKYADFSYSEASYYQFQTLGVSLFDRLSQSSASLNLVGLNSYYKGTLGGLDPMKFYYTAQGDSIYGICNGSFSQLTSPSYFKGLGLALSGDYRFNIANEETGKSMSMQLSISNLGFAVSNSVRTQTLDTSFAFGGYTLSQLINREGLLAPGFSYADSLLVTETRSKVIFLPASIQIFNVINTKSPARIQPSYGFRMILIPGYIPYVYAGLVTKIIPGLHLGLCASYGGFSGFKLNSAIHYNYKRLSMGIGSDNVIGLVSKRAFGKSLSIRLRCDI